MNLLSPQPFWPKKDGLPHSFPALDGDVDCDVAIIGGGITGACVAWELADAGLAVVVLDRREVAHGSTAGNTGLMLYELDVPLERLAQRIGRGPAERAFRRCRDAIPSLERRVRQLAIDCDFRRRSSLYVAAQPGHVARLRREFLARRAAGFAVEWWPARRVRTESTLPHAAGILSADAAELDAYRLTYGLLQAAERCGARVHDRTEVTSWRDTSTGVRVRTPRGMVTARSLVLASGYEAAASYPELPGRLHSTFALVTEPLPNFNGWPADRCLIWDTGNPYLYLRTTPDGRAIIGGYDEPFRNPSARDRLLRSKVAALKRRFAQFFPKIPIEIASAWAGTFGVTADGLPFIGPHPSAPHVWLALGFGGNGTTFSVIAGQIIRRGILGVKDRDAGLFGLRLPRRG